MADTEQGKGEEIVTTIEVDKEAFLRFKALCVLNETKISEEIEKLIKKRVSQLSKTSNFQM